MNIETEQENTVAEIVGIVSMAEISLARFRQRMLEHGSDNYGDSVQDQLVELSRVNRLLGKLYGLKLAQEFEE